MVKKLLIAFATVLLVTACTKPGGGDPPCPAIPPVGGGPSPTSNPGYVWATAYVDWVNGGWQEVPGHWERPRDARDHRSIVRIPGYWDTTQRSCVWIPSRRP